MPPADGGPGRGLPARVERWLFAPGDPRRLAAVRIGLCGLLAARLASGPYPVLATQPPRVARREQPPLDPGRQPPARPAVSRRHRRSRGGR